MAMRTPVRIFGSSTRVSVSRAERAPQLHGVPLDEAAATVELGLVWHARSHADPAHLATRGVLREGAGAG